MPVVEGQGRRMMWSLSGHMPCMADPHSVPFRTGLISLLPGVFDASALKVVGSWGLLIANDTALS